MVRLLETLHREQPYSAAFRMDAVIAAALAQPADRRPPSHRGAGQAQPDAPELLAAVDRLVARGALERRGRRVSLPGSGALGSEVRWRADELIRRLRAAAPSVPRTDGVARAVGLPDAAVERLRRDGELVSIGPEIDLPADVVDALRTQLVDLVRLRGGLATAEYRDVIGAGRRHAVAILEYFDRTGVTRRDGEVRTLA